MGHGLAGALGGELLPGVLLRLHVDGHAAPRLGQVVGGRAMDGLPAVEAHLPSFHDHGFDLDLIAVGFQRSQLSGHVSAKEIRAVAVADGPAVRAVDHRNRAHVLGAIGKGHPGGDHRPGAALPITLVGVPAHHRRRFTGLVAAAARFVEQLIVPESHLIHAHELGRRRADIGVRNQRLHEHRIGQAGVVIFAQHGLAVAARLPTFVGQG